MRLKLLHRVLFSHLLRIRGRNYQSCFNFVYHALISRTDALVNYHTGVLVAYSRDAENKHRPDCPVMPHPRNLIRCVEIHLTLFIH